MELPQEIAFKLREDNRVSISRVNTILRDNKMGKLIFSVWINSVDGQNTLEKVAKHLNITTNLDTEFYEIINGGNENGSWVKSIFAFEYFKFLPEELKIQATNDLKSFLTKNKQPIELYPEELNVEEASEIKNESISEIVEAKIDNTQNELTIIEKQELEEKFQELFTLEQANPGGFIIPFELAWKILGYSRSDKAKQGLERSDLRSNIDYRIPQLGDSQTSGKPKFDADLTSRGFKKWGLSAPTEKGRLIRDYFIEIETKFKLLNQINKKSDNIETSENQNENTIGIVETKIDNTQNALTIIEKQELEEKFQELFKLEQANPGGFTVDFNFAWQVIKFSKKSHAKRLFDSLGFEKNVDFQCPDRGIEKTGGKQEITPILTIDATKQFWLSAKTEIAKDVRKYFIETEKKWQILKQSLNSGQITMIDNQSGESYLEWKNKAENQIKDLTTQNQLLLKEKEDSQIQAKYEIFIAEQLAIINEKYKALAPLIPEYYNQPLTYLAYIGTYPTVQNNNHKTPKIEFGYTADLQTRLRDHENDFDQFKIIGLFRSPMAKSAEKEFAKQTKTLKIRTTHKTKLGNHIELVYLTEDFNIKEIFKIMQEIIDNLNLYNVEIEKMKIECELKLKDKKIGELKDLKLEIMIKENKIKELENELKIYKPNRKTSSKK